MNDKMIEKNRTQKEAKSETERLEMIDTQVLDEQHEWYMTQGRKGKYHDVFEDLAIESIPDEVIQSHREEMERKLEIYCPECGMKFKDSSQRKCGYCDYVGFRQVEN